jgi:hypothetical protein
MTARQLNPLGLIVGGPGHQPLVVLARGADGTERWIDEVARGLACDCTCLECGHRLVARQGPVREWSFAHQAASDCSGGVESQAHRYAKAVINEAGGLHVASTRPDRWGELHPRFMEVAPLRTEERVAGFRADLVGSLDGHELIIEVKVTHGCPVHKVRAYRDLDLSVLEIDLSPFRYASAEVLREAVLRRATRYWLSLRGGREVPRKHEPVGQTGSDSASGGKGVTRPSGVSRREWAEMSTLQKLAAFDPDGRKVLKSRGFRG